MEHAREPTFRQLCIPKSGIPLFLGLSLNGMYHKSPLLFNQFEEILTTRCFHWYTLCQKLLAHLRSLKLGREAHQ